MLKHITIFTCLYILLSSCSFVSLDKNARHINVAATQAQLENCKYLGDVTTTLWNKADSFESTKSVEEQLEILALNKAAAIGGNVIIAKTAIIKNQRTFGVYKCNNGITNL